MQFGSDLEFLLKHLFRAFREDVPANLLCAESISVLSQAHVVQQFYDLVRVEETITSSSCVQLWFKVQTILWEILVLVTYDVQV